jgi:hypothetical protein
MTKTNGWERGLTPMEFHAVSLALWLIGISSGVVAIVAAGAISLAAAMERGHQRQQAARDIQAVEEHLAGQARDTVH